MTGAEILGAAASLVLGYVIGSLPLRSLVGLMARAEDRATTASLWRGAGPGWALLAFAVDLARGILPVALALVTFSWAAGLASGAGALAGTLWPAGGRLPADRSPVLVLGVLLVLTPLLGLLVACTLGAAFVVRRPSTAR